MIDTRDQIVDSSLIQKAIDKLPKGMNAVKEARDMFKSRRSYTKWFNTVPLLGVGALGVNKYFVNNEGKIMIFDKKDETCGKIRDKLKFIHTVLDTQKLVEEYYSKRSKVKVKETISTDNET